MKQEPESTLARRVLRPAKVADSLPPPGDRQVGRQQSQVPTALPAGAFEAGYRHAVSRLEAGGATEAFRLCDELAGPTVGLRAYALWRAGEREAAAAFVKQHLSWTVRTRTPQAREDAMYFFFMRGVIAPEGEAEAHLATAEAIAVELGRDDFRRRIWAEYGDRACYTLEELREFGRQGPEFTLDTLYHGFLFDELIDSEDQQVLRATFEVLRARADGYRDDPLLQCRYAQLLILFKDYQEALLALDGNSSMLARGLRAKALASMDRPEEVLAITERFEEALRSGDELDLEGAVHMLEMRGWARYCQRRYLEAFDYFCRAETVAEQLWLEGRLKTLAANKEAVRNRLQEPLEVDKELPPTGNAFLYQHQAIVRMKTLMLQGDFEGAAKVAGERLSDDALRSLVVGSKNFRRGRNYEAAQAIDLAVPLEPEYAFYWGLLQLCLFVRTGDRVYTSPDRGLEAIRDNLGRLRYPVQVLADARRLYPLGLLLAAAHEELLVPLRRESKRVPVLREAGGRGGLFVGEEFLVTIPKGAREVLRLAAGEFVEEGDFTRSDRYRYRRALAKAGVEAHEFVVEEELLLGLRRLEEVLPGVGFGRAARWLAGNPGELAERAGEE